MFFTWKIITETDLVLETQCTQARILLLSPCGPSELYCKASAFMRSADVNPQILTFSVMSLWLPVVSIFDHLSMGK